MATTFRIACYAESQEAAEKAADECFQRIARLNKIFSDYDPTSELMKLCAPGTKYPQRVSSPLFSLLQTAMKVAEQTNGAFDPTAGHLTNLWRRAKRKQELPAEERLQRAISVTGWRRIQLDAESHSVTLEPGTLLDLGGIAKGYAADDCLRLLKRKGIARAVVQAGGDTAAGDPPPGEQGWEVKIRTFTQPGEDDPLTMVRLANSAVSTSGDLYQFVEIAGKRYSHIISPTTGVGLTDRIACTVFAPNCTTSDALATAMCVLGREKGEALAATIPGIKVQFALQK